MNSPAPAPTPPEAALERYQDALDNLDNSIGTLYRSLFRVARLILLGVNFALIGTIAARFLGGGSGLIEIGSFVFSTFITLLQAENALTHARSRAIDLKHHLH